MSVIDDLRTYLANCPSLETGALLLVEQLGALPVQYAIVPMPGARIVETYLDGSTLREFPFAFQTAQSTADDLERIENIAFFEIFADWLETQTAAGTLPTLDTGKTATAIEALNWGYLYEQGQSETGIYQITCKLTYEQGA